MTSAYRKPQISVVVVGGVDERVIGELNDLLRSSGVRGLKIIVLSKSTRDVSKVLEDLRDFLFSNVSFTIEVYVEEVEKSREVLDTEIDNLVEILVTNKTSLEEIPSTYRDLVKVV